jgi:ribosomal protein S18 acetylase RimI-like enzyme
MQNMVGPSFLDELWLNLIVAAAGGAITVGFVRTRKWFSDQRIERLYPIAGTYISNFEDQREGQTIKVSASANFSQVGKALKGITSVGDRCWVLEGKITDDNYIYGRYFAESIYDRGNGNFFLQICPEGELRGLWSGFDSISGKIETGKYTFKKALPVSIVPVQKSLIPGIIKVSQTQLGELFLHESDIVAPDNIGFCALHKNRVVGFCIGRIMASKDFTMQHPSIAQLVSPEIFESTDRVGFFASLAVDPSVEGQGIGTKLMRSVVERLDSSDISVSFLSGWKSHKGLHIGGVARAIGFDVVREVEDFYKDSSLEHGYHCPVCGGPPCRCSAVVMIRTK